MPKATQNNQPRPRVPPDIEMPRGPVEILPAPLYGKDEDRELWEEQQAMRAETLMTKGLRDPRTLMSQLDITNRSTMERIIRRVHARWEMRGLNRDHAKARGEALERLDMLERRLWIMLDAAGAKAPDTKESIVIIKQITDIQNQRSALKGLTEKTIERLGQTGSEAATSFAKKLGEQEQLTAIAARALEMLKGRRGEKDQAA